jgi:organic radical activating enzyme
MNESHIVELFSSIQGEGLLVGERQIFVRFSGCNVRCDYCDTLHEGITDCQVEEVPGQRNFIAISNPITNDILIEHIAKWCSSWPSMHHSVSVTGGEPLLHNGFLAKWLPGLRELLPVCLETNGILHEALIDVLDSLDYISMDIKLPSSSGLSGLWHDHEMFLRLAARKNVSVKCVISEGTEVGEIESACSIISSVDQSIPLILQPVTLKNGAIGISSQHILSLHYAATKQLQHVRVIPQLHKVINML